MRYLPLSRKHNYFESIATCTSEFDQGGAFCCSGSQPFVFKKGFSCLVQLCIYRCAKIKRQILARDLPSRDEGTDSEPGRRNSTTCPDLTTSQTKGV